MQSLNNLSGVETIFGPVRFVAVYALSALGGSVASLVMVPQPSLGASGAICGLLGALWSFFAVNERYMTGGMKRANSILLSAASTLAIGLFLPMVDNWSAPAWCRRCACD